MVTQKTAQRADEAPTRAGMPPAEAKRDGDRDLILVVDDERGVRDVVALFMADEGYEVVTAESGREAMRVIRAQQPDLVLLDISMPDMDGREVMKEIRRASRVPVIFLTARHTAVEKKDSLDLGADDYVVKPFHIDELAARVRAVLRRVKGAVGSSGRLRVGDLELDLERRLLLRDGRLIQLGRTEWLLLRELAVNGGRVVLNSELLRAVWGEQFGQDYGLLRIGISRLRRKLGTAPRQPGPIVTYPGVGYMLTAEAAVDG